MTTPTDRIWEFPGPVRPETRRVIDALGVSRLVADSIVDRGIEDLEEARRFLEPEADHLLDPFEFPSMGEACEAIHAAVANGTRIAVYGDYDVDGMSGSVLLDWVLRRIGASSEIFIPDRMTEGYGLGREAIQRLADGGVGLIVTVDNGISAGEEIAFARGLGIQVVVTDHHTLPDELPRDAILLHPRIPGREYPFGELCGTGVAFKLGLALLATSKLADREKAVEGFQRTCIDIVAIGTVADMVPLVGENRVLVREGLLQLSRTVHPGLRAMLGIERLLGRRLTVEHIGFKICPKINSVGRIDDYRLALRFYTARNEAEAGELALRLEKINHDRVRMVKELMERALAQDESWADRAAPVLVLETAHKGLVGLVAQRLRERYNKPFLVLAADGDRATGSGRSVDGFDLVAELRRHEKLLMRYGGHAMAVGLTLERRRIPELSEALESAVAGRLSRCPEAPPVRVQAVLEPTALTLKTVEELDRLAPFGQGNPAPLLALRSVPVSGISRLGDGTHVRLASPLFPRGLKNIGFNLTDQVQGAMDSSSRLDLAFHLETDFFAGRESLQMRLQAVRPV